MFVGDGGELGGRAGVELGLWLLRTSSAARVGSQPRFV